MADKKNLNYISEISLNSELQLFNNYKLLKVDKSLFNDTYIKEIEELREEYELLDFSDETGIQVYKKEIRDKIRTKSSKTFIYRDQNIFGEMMSKVINRLSTSARFSGYSYVNEMKSLATQHILLYTHKFDPFRKSTISEQYVSAFAYITTICMNAFVATINAHHKEEKKAKDEFIETQKLFHRDSNVSTYGEDYTLPKEHINIKNIHSTLLDEIKKIPITKDDISLLYPEDYKISLDEYDKISKYIKVNNMTISIVRDLNE